YRPLRGSGRADDPQQGKRVLRPVYDRGVRRLEDRLRLDAAVNGTVLEHDLSDVIAVCELGIDQREACQLVRVCDLNGRDAPRPGRKKLRRSSSPREVVLP